MPDTPVILVRDARDARIIKGLALAKTARLLTLTPAAAVFFADGPYQVIRTQSVYDDRMHAQTVRHLKEGLAELERLAGQQGLSDAQTEAACHAWFYMLATASFLYHALQDFHEIHWLGSDKALQSAGSRDEAFAGILSAGRLVHRRHGRRSYEASFLRRKLIDWHSGLTSRLLSGRKKLLIVDGPQVRPSSRSFAQAAARHDERLAVLLAHAPSQGLWTTFRYMLRSLWLARMKGMSGKKYPPMFFFYPQAVRSHMPEMNAIAAGIEDEFRRKALALYKPRLEEIVRQTRGYELALERQVRRLAPDIVSTDSITTGFNIAVCEQARKRGAQVLLFNHASHYPQTEEPSRTIGDLWASLGRIDSPHATTLAVRSPPIAQLIRELSPHGDKIAAVRHDKRVEPARSGRPFQILLAGNYMGVHNHIPWMLETPDEFLDGIAELAQAVGQLPEARLVIRLKPQNAKTEVSLSSMKQFVPQFPNVEISNAGTFMQALADADLVVASISTTIDQALSAGRPVLLHSGPKRYHHLSGMSTPPTNARRSAVYVSGKTPLAALLQGIMAMHKNQPLREDELNGLVWPENSPDMGEFAKATLDYQGQPTT
jgi:hypothetical protein